MKPIRTIWMFLAMAMAAVPCSAQGTDGAGESPATGKLTIEQAGSLLKTGRAAFEDGLYPLAKRRLEELVAGAPDKRRKAEGALWLARVLLAEKNPEGALAVLEAHGGPTQAASFAAEYSLSRAQAYFELKQMAPAAEELSAFQAKFVDQESAPVALRLLARARAAQGEWDAARATCALIESNRAGSAEAPAAWLDVAEALGDAGRTDEAQAALEHVETRYAGQPWAERASLKNAELALAKGSRPQAMKKLQALAANTNLQAETRAQGYRIVAQALGAESNYTAALEMIDQGIAASADPAQRMECSVVKARMLLSAGRLDEGAALMRTVAAQVPDEKQSAQLQLDLADSLFRLGRWNEAAAEYQAWLDAFDGSAGTASALAGRGWALWEAARYEEAAPVFERAAGTEADSDKRLALLQKLADSQFAGGQLSKAKESYAAVLKAAPAGGELAGRAQLQLAETELALGETEAGEIRLLDLSSVHKESEWSRTAILRLGALYEDRGALETAMEQYGRIIEPCSEAKSCATALLARGLIRYRMGAFQGALDDFGRLCDELPQTPPVAQATFMRGWCYYMLGKDAKALQACERFLVDYPQSEFAPDVRFWLGEHAFNLGDYETAEKRFDSVATDHPESLRASEALYWAGRAAAARRAYLAANAHFNALMSRYPDSPKLAETLLAQGDVLSELGQFPAAILAFNEVIVKFPQRPEAMMAWGRKGDCQYTLGQENKARYEEALLSYRTLLDFANAPVDLRLQAGYKTGRCLEKMGRSTAALDRYMEVVYAYLQEAKPPTEATVWFTRAAFGAAALQERAGKWKEAFGIYSRVADSGVPSAAEARDRMGRIRAEHWALF